MAKVLEAAGITVVMAGSGSKETVDSAAWHLTNEQAGMLIIITDTLVGVGSRWTKLLEDWFAQGYLNCLVLEEAQTYAEQFELRYVAFSRFFDWLVVGKGKEIPKLVVSGSATPSIIVWLKDTMKLQGNGDKVLSVKVEDENFVVGSTIRFNIGGGKVFETLEMAVKEAAKQIVIAVKNGTRVLVAVVNKEHVPLVIDEVKSQCASRVPLPAHVFLHSDASADAREAFSLWVQNYLPSVLLAFTTQSCAGLSPVQVRRNWLLLFAFCFLLFAFAWVAAESAKFSF